MNPENFILATDSYKLGHWKQYPAGTRGVYSYLEARVGATFPQTVFFGLQSILRDLEDKVVGPMDIVRARELAEAHFGTPDLFNQAGWERITTKHGGRLPVRIRAVPEGTPVPAGNVLMTVENTDPECFWLTNALESLLLHVWYPTTVASLSYNTKQMLKAKLEASADSLDALPFMLHDFGYRGATTHEAAAIGGAGHLVNFMGTDTLPAMQLLMRDYAADLGDLAFSVPATEHSVMTSLGAAGEHKIVSDLIDAHPTGILSVVADSYDIYRFVEAVGGEFKHRILARDGKFVVRPDSVTLEHPTPEALVVDLLERLWRTFEGATNSKGFRVLDPHVGLLWGDGIGPDGIERILDEAMRAGFSAENMVFGMGGGLLQKVNRDTQRFAFKASAQHRNGVWVPVSKNPLDRTKASKAGRLKLVEINGQLQTAVENTGAGKNYPDVLRTVFEDGEILVRDTLADVRQRAA
jgi:nicotinamide phosphoribosyltransferase